LAPEVNEAVEIAHTSGILTAASLMVGAPAVDDAVARARRLPALRVGLHLVLSGGRPMLPADKVPDLVDAEGRFRTGMVGAGMDIFFRANVRKQLAAEIAAQFAAYRATGLVLDHVNCHHHFQLHPTIASQIFNIGSSYGLRGVRVPAEPVEVLNRIETGRKHRRDWLTAPWIALLKARVRSRSLSAADQVFGLAWSGAMTEQRVAGLLRHLPIGVTEIYFHPATSCAFAGAANGYRYTDELAALTAPAVKDLLRATGAKSGGFADFMRT
jgi:chitin disaccharide deacetylase